LNYSYYYFFQLFFNVWLDICRPGRNLFVVVVDGDINFLFPLDFFSLPFLTISDDFVVGNGFVARVTEGERRFGLLLDLDLDRLDDEVDWERERDDRDELIKKKISHKIYLENNIIPKI